MSTDDLAVLLAAYEAEVQARADLAVETKRTCIVHARRFVQWTADRR